jgi:hypothetical protein
MLQAAAGLRILSRPLHEHLALMLRHWTLLRLRNKITKKNTTSIQYVERIFERRRGFRISGEKLLM